MSCLDKTPSNCLICGTPFISVINDYNSDIVYLCCFNQEDHTFCAATINAKKVFRISFSFSSLPDIGVEIDYYFCSNAYIKIGKRLDGIMGVGVDPPPLIVPYFEPDFSDCQKLAQKIKMYMVFS